MENCASEKLRSSSFLEFWIRSIRTLRGTLTGPSIFGSAQHLNVRGRVLTIYMTSKSGKIIYRNKIDTIIGIVHPGIILGADKFGVVWVIHNHYKIGYPEIVTLEEFAEGVDVFEDIRAASKPVLMLSTTILMAIK